ncbi:hypothetical protein M433DRAFT_158145, partial [Acidomyces richmondensis BFW]
RFSTSNSGWILNSYAFEWIQTVFEPYTRPTSPKERRLLIMDGYSSHITADFIAFCIDNAIDILILPPHFSHALQPLNVSYPLDLSLLASSLLDSTELRKANALLHSKLDKEQPLLLPTKRYTKRITCTLKIAQSEVALLRKWLTDTESLPQARKQRKKGKRIALKGKFVFSTQEVLDIAKQAELKAA